MYTSNGYYTSDDNDNPISPYTINQTLSSKPSIYAINPNSKGENSPHHFCCSILSPFNQFQNDDGFVQHMDELYLRQHQINEVNAVDSVRTEMIEHSENIKDMLGECSSKQNESAMIKEITEKRQSRKDRHSKIETAQGPRDRRMRLSLQVARDFFDLQDTLGFNKASKTVEWLLKKSEAEIKDLTSCRAICPSSTSLCETTVPQEKVEPLASSTKGPKNARVSTRKSVFNPLLKETREKARARARDRTREKRKGDVSKLGYETMRHHMNLLGSWSHNEKNYPNLQLHEDVADLGPSMIYTYHMHSNEISQEYQFTGFDLPGKPWNAYMK